MANLPIKRLWLGDDQHGQWQKVEFESRPTFCGHCERLGHGEQECFRLHLERRHVRREIGIPNQAYIPKEHKENESVTAALFGEQE